MSRILSTLYFILFISVTVFGQTDRFWADNGFELETDRYKKFIGSPYIFENFLLADITEYTGQVFENIPINFNAHTQNFELKKGEKLYLLNQQKYLIIRIPKEKNEDSYPWGNEKVILFKRGFHPDFLDNFVQLIYDGSRIKLIRSFRQGLDKKVFQDVGKKIEIKRFNSQDRHYLIVEGESMEIEMKEKDLKKALGHSDIIEEFLETHQLSLENTDDLVSILEFLEKEG